MKIVVTGANGWIGSRVAAALTESGHTVRRFVRRPAIASDFLFDLAHPHEGWRDALRNVDVVVHSAALVHLGEREARTRAAEFTRVNVAGTQALLAATKAANVTRIVLVSSIAVYGGHYLGSETGTLSPETVYARSKCEAECATASAGLDHRICRLATVFGAGDRANFARLATAMGRGRFLVPGDGSARKSVVPVDLTARILAAAAVTPTWPHPIVNVALPIAPSLAEICAAFADQCGLGPARRVPLGALRLGAAVGDLGEALGLRLPLNSTVLRKLTHDSIVTTAFLEELGLVDARETFREALRPYADYYRGLAHAS